MWAVDERAGSLPTKLRQPEPPVDLVPRPRLTEAILRGLERSTTLVCAPAGYGKTTALAAALAASPYPVAWLSLDAGDDDPATFLRLLIAAIQTHWRDACQPTLGLLQLPILPAIPFIGRMLADDLATLPAPLVVVLEDYQCLACPDIHTLLGVLLRRPPAALRLAITTRTVAPLPLARLRADGQLAEVELAHLRFTAEETRALLERSTGCTVPADEAAGIHTRMDGWAVGLRLACIARRDWANSPAALPTMADRADRYAEAYLLEEVVDQQPIEARELLLRTSLVERFSASLAGALLDGDAAQCPAILARLEANGLFVQALDTQHEWYRYHDLFREVLQRQLQHRQPPAMIRGLHARASAWFAAQGMVDDAIRHALVAGDAEGAGWLVERHIEEPLMSDGWPRLERWLALLPAELVQRRPALLLAAVWVAYFRYALRKIPPLLEATEALLAAEAAPPRPESEALRAEVDLWKALLWILRGDGAQAIPHAQRAWERLPASRAEALGQAGAFLTIARQMDGMPEPAAAVFHSCRLAELEEHPTARTRLLFGVVCAQFAAADFRLLESLLRQLLQLTQQTGYETHIAWTHYFLGRVYYESNDLNAALEHYSAVIARRDRAHCYALRASLQGLALTYQALARAQEAVAVADQLVELALATGGSEPEHFARAFRARLALAQGDWRTRDGWLRTADPAASYELPLAIEVPALTRVRALVAQGTDRSLGEASRSLPPLLDLYGARHDTLRVIEILALQATACRAQGEMEQALTLLHRALELAAPGGLIRTFVDLGPPVAALLAELARHSNYREYLSQVLAAFGDDARGTFGGLPDREAAAVLIEPLSEREREVLVLLADRLSNKEIGARLCVSWQTIAKHTNNIYQKLQVSGRRAAIDRARRLGLVAPL
jgi:LuxR family maltose regulon positive regulatory protein